MGAASSSSYRGRFAPSPTGPLHFGSLLAAIGSFADARAHQGRWLVRIEDLDSNRAVAGADHAILSTLEAFGLYWDETVVYQSQRQALYQHALEQLRQAGLSYPCACTRREIAARGTPGPEGPIYPGTCRAGLPPNRSARSERLRIDDVAQGVSDAIQGHILQHLAQDVGDVVLRRADGFFAYQLAVVVDDAEQGIHQVVRGADLLASTPRQVYLQRCLGLPQPAYAHLPLVLGEDGRKLSKSLAAAPVDPRNPLPALERAWCLLGQTPLDATPSDVDDFWRQAIPGWDLGRVPKDPHRIGADEALTPASQ
ncbi:tRNA glutamyl-Q(34) synthetase GluQRS [Halochromatium salexigens]|uniref:Glutamyl-Q tRNA(Asp) synthetase n=1 Tax=Halochromatium salexigens TaxID=49447 RepID=A0AAJ0UIE5_HALSE|nr:tRNA glutamyl-Q(34) synthetase GluQRS [Halochromatium salexigens]MBK5932080.1 tRNA glutamyl-Q(34) synthetase GluQRS [Halochromatium salexigens]